MPRKIENTQRRERLCVEFQIDNLDHHFLWKQIMNPTPFYPLVLAVLLMGCQSEQETEAKQQNDTAVAENTETTTEPQENGASDPDKEAYWDRITDLYEQAKASGQTTAENAKQWLGEMYDQTASAGQSTADGTARRVRELYEEAKKRGETSASSAKEWVMDDIGRMGAWDYKTLRVAADDNVDIEKELNKMGAQRWDCFWVDKNGSTTTFYFKKPSRSYLRQIPARELMRLLPLLGGGGDSPE